MNYNPEDAIQNILADFNQMTYMKATAVAQLQVEKRKSAKLENQVKELENKVKEWEEKLKSEESRPAQ
jgi:N-formylglutamate amidohydrolase